MVHICSSTDTVTGWKKSCFILSEFMLTSNSVDAILKAEVRELPAARGFNLIIVVRLSRDTQLTLSFELKLYSGTNHSTSVDTFGGSLQ